MNPKKPHPWAKCIDCHAFFDDSLADEPCPVCKKSTVKREARTNTWFECQNCNATGIAYSETCKPCKGEGWLFTEVFTKPNYLAK